MRILVCGGRDFNDYDLLHMYMCTIDGATPDSVIIHGAAKGADSLADKWAKDNNIKLKVYPADWEQHGKSAGPIRNQQMLNEGKPDLVLAFPGGKGTAHMVSIARKKGVKVIEVTCN